MKIGLRNEVASAEVKRYSMTEQSKPKEVPKIKEERVSDIPKESETVTKPDNVRLKKMIEEANAKMNRTNRQLKFELFESTGGNTDVAIKVVDTQTKEVLVEIPSEEMIEFSNRMEEVIGMLFDKKG